MVIMVRYVVVILHDEAMIGGCLDFIDLTGRPDRVKR